MKYIEMESFSKENCDGWEITGPKLESFVKEESSDLIVSDDRSSKVDGRSKPRTQKQIELYRYNFSTRRDSLAKRVEQELDSRLSFLQRTSRVVLVSISMRGK